MARRTSAADLSAAVMGLIGTRGPLSRAEIARALGVSPAAVTNLTKSLIDDGMLCTVGTAPSGGGRPKVLLDLTQARRLALGVKITPNHLTMAEVDLAGTPGPATSVDVDMRSADAVDVIAATIAKHTRGRLDHLLGVGLAVPGTVDRGLVTAPALGWNSVPLAQIVHDRVGLPVIIDNDVNALAVAGRLYDPDGLGADSLLVTIGYGVGAAIVSGDHLFRGSRGGAGEIGHLCVAPDGEQCSCGLRGCLETLVGDDALARQARALGVIGPEGTKDDLNRAALAGDAAAAAVFDTAARELGTAIASLVHVLDPDSLHVSGEGVDVWQFWEHGFKQALRAHLPAHRRDLRVIVKPWADDTWAHGAASLVFATPFSSRSDHGSSEVRELLRGGS